MASKTKIFKGLKYFSEMFNEKEDDIQIGFPTDVKHVAHIGSNGPATDAPTWMKGFKSAPLAPTPDSKEEPEIQWVSEDTKTKRTQKSASSSGESETKAKKDPSKSRIPRRHHSASSQQSSDSSDAASSSSRSLPDIPKKARRRKSKDADGSTRVRSRATGASNAAANLDSGSDTGSALPPAGPKTSNGQNAGDEGVEKSDF